MTETLIGKEVEPGEIEIVEPKQVFDPKPFDGSKVRIERVEYTEFETHYIDGEWDDKKTTIQQGVLVITEPVTQVLSSNGVKTDIRVKQRFNLQKRIDEKGIITWVTSKNNKSKLWRLCRKCGVEDPSQLKGKLVVLTLEPSSDINDERMYLRISV